MPYLYLFNKIYETIFKNGYGLICLGVFRFDLLWLCLYAGIYKFKNVRINGASVGLIQYLVPVIFIELEINVLAESPVFVCELFRALSVLTADVVHTAEYPDRNIAVYFFTVFLFAAI